MIAAAVSLVLAAAPACAQDGALAQDRIREIVGERYPEYVDSGLTLAGYGERRFGRQVMAAGALTLAAGVLAALAIGFGPPHSTGGAEIALAAGLALGGPAIGAGWHIARSAERSAASFRRRVGACAIPA